MKNKILVGLVLLSVLMIFVFKFLLLNKVSAENVLLVSFCTGMLAGVPVTLLGLNCMQEISKNLKAKAAKTPYTDINLMDTKFEKCG